jgi:hypothetical protein
MIVRQQMSIEFYNKQGALIGSVPASSLRSFKAAANADHRKMDDFKRKHPEAVLCVLNKAKFEFDKNGRSNLVSFG